MAVDTQTSAAALRIGIHRCAQLPTASDAMQAALERVAELCAVHGCTMIDITEPAELAAARNAHATIQNFEAGLALADDLLRFGEQMSPRLRDTLIEGRHISPENYDAARRMARRGRAAAHDLFASCDVLLTPSAPAPALWGLALRAIRVSTNCGLCLACRVSRCQAWPTTPVYR
ncbi:MAG: hypothetical protein HC779_04485 [Phyllobacteriaceae bacterium]|nr:hypothetical protein [Phyllobacteriaceae bacterium]